MNCDDSTRFLGMLAEVASAKRDQQCRSDRPGPQQKRVEETNKRCVDSPQMATLCDQQLATLLSHSSVGQLDRVYSFKCDLTPTHRKAVIESVSREDSARHVKRIQSIQCLFNGESVDDCDQNKTISGRNNTRLLKTVFRSNDNEVNSGNHLSCDNNARICDEMSVVTIKNCFDDHLYTSTKGPTKPALLSKQEKQTVVALKKKCPIISKVIATPAFPYVYEPVLPNISQVIEIKSTSTDKKKANSEIRSERRNVNNEMIESPEISQTGLLALKYIDDVRLESRTESDGSECFSCRICTNKTFNSATSLIYHYRSHAGVHKPYECTICDATFTRQHSLNYHMLIHLNKSRFVCDECGRNFRHPSHFKEHKRRHTGETPYECNECFIKFKTRNTYKRHLHTKHGKILTIKGIVDIPNSNLHLRKPCPPRRKYGLGYLHQNIEAVARYERAQQQMNYSIKQNELYTEVHANDLMMTTCKVYESTKNNFEKLLQAVAIAEDNKNML